jgi:hypothetical protein
MSDGTHDLIAPSGLAITVQCPRSLGLQLGVPDEKTEESMEGDAAHWLAMMTANGIPIPKGAPAPNGVIIDQDMIDGAELYASVLGEGYTLEEKVRIPRLHPTHCGGTPDAKQYFPLAQVLRLPDYKYGHRFVEVFENPQLVGYAAGEMDRLNLPWTHQTWIEFILIQPRSYHPEGPVRKWGCYGNELLELVKKIRERVALAVDDAGNIREDAPAQTGPECRDCKARHLCTLFQANVAHLVDASGRADRFELPPAQLAAELSYIDAAMQRLKGRRSGLAIQAEELIRRGTFVPGYEMSEGRSNLAWRDDADVDTVSSMAAALGAILCRDVQLVTPTQAKAEFKRRHLDPELLDAYTHRPRGKMELAQSSTTRARKAFGASSN